jgi:hypothetical protein
MGNTKKGPRLFNSAHPSASDFDLGSPNHLPMPWRGL